MATPEFTHWSSVKASPYRDLPIADPVSEANGRKTAFSEKTHFWMLLDAITVTAATTIAILVHSAVDRSLPHPSVFLGPPPNVFYFYIAGFTLVLLTVSRARGLYESLLGRSGLREQRLSMESCLISGLILAGTLYLARENSVSRAVVITTILMTAFLLALRRGIWRYITYKRFERGLESRNVLIIGTGASAVAVRNHLQRIRHLGFTCKGFIRTGSEESNSTNSEDVIGDTTEIARLVRQYFIDDIFVTGPCERGLIHRLLAEAAESGVNVRVFPDLYDGMAWNAPVEYVGQFPTLPLHRRRLPVYGLLLKRMLDILVSFAAVVFLSPVMLAVAMVVRMDSKGPVLYRSQRIGRKGRAFQCFKFRTMVADAEARKESLLYRNERDGVLFKISDDPRVTRVGRFLRKYSLDEMPQFLNVLLGDMSIVGPRPPLAGEVSQYELPHLRRLDVLPGITGLWQVQARQDPSFDNYISLDTAYVDNWSIWLDLKIMTRTFGVVLSGTGN